MSDKSWSSEKPKEKCYHTWCAIEKPIILRFRCDGKPSCSAFANATDFPNEVDPCPSTVKYLEAQFYCMKLKVTQQPPSPSSEATNSGK